MNAINTTKIKCTGCAACANICPKNAIVMRQDEEGFYKPYIDADKCVDCGLCNKVCPESNLAPKYTKTPGCYAVMADDEIRKVSSSGGAFSVIAHEIFKRGGVVAGAAFDENWKVHHIIIDKEDDMVKLRGSKYVQSFISEDIYRNLKRFLQDGRYVLFTGTPCQVAGFKNFLGKGYENLLLIDLVCTGTPSPFAFDKYIEDANLKEKGIKTINFRDKESQGWKCSHLTVATEAECFTDEKYMHSFLSKSLSNDSCGFCKYASIDRVSDITLADFWGIERYKEDLNDDKGTSLYLANSNKGKEFFELICDSFIRIEEVPLFYAMQPAMKAPYKHSKTREKFLKDIKTKPFDVVYEKYSKFWVKKNSIFKSLFSITNKYSKSGEKSKIIIILGFKISMKRK